MPPDLDPNAVAQRVFLSVVVAWSVIGLGAIAFAAAVAAYGVAR